MNRQRSQGGPAFFASALALSLCLGVAGCAPAATVQPANPTPTFGAQDFAPGTRVEVSRNSQWFPATVLQPFGDRFLIHYENFGNEWNETVGLDRIRVTTRVVDGTLGAASQARDYRVGEKVLVQMANRLAFGEITHQLAAASWRVHYDGYGAEVGEVVGPDRLRRPFAGASAHPIGSEVGVEFNGQVVGGKVLAVAAADRWVVRFPSFGADFDQEVGADRLRPAPPAVAPPAVPPPAVAPPQPPAKAEGAAAPLQVGDAVFVSQRGASYLPGTIASGANGVWKVHYEAGATGDDDVPTDRLIRAPQSLKGAHYAPNQNVYIEWHGMWVPGHVVKEPDKSQYRVRFDGQGPDSDEIVPAKRLRVR